jgi:RimJ/RimL family protein N-acetyltransferase
MSTLVWMVCSVRETPMARDPRPELDQVDPLEVAPGEWGRRATLRDGTSVLLRQIRPEDRDRLAQGLRRLSPASRYLRFHTDIEALTDRQLDYLSQVDHIDHEAIIALDLDRPEVPGIGVARYIRDARERHVAEGAVTVADEYQGQGAGTMLMGVLAARARRHGVEVFRNYVLDRNQAMLDLFDELGATRELESSGLWRVDLSLPERESDLPDSPAGKAFIAAAKQGAQLASLFPPVWCQLPFGVISRSSTATGIEAELATLRGDLDPWLADREQRDLGWPVEADEHPAGHDRHNSDQPRR